MLKGLRVIDFSHYLPGPFATLRLAEMGAEVIKVEPLGGDPARNTEPEKEGTGLVYLAHNRNKKSITLNLKEEQGREIALQLIAGADVVLESFRPGVMDKLGLGYDAVREIKPDIIYCSISGYGQKGMFSSLGSHDLNYLAISGVLAQLKGEDGKPVHPTITLADFAGGLAANERILAGLVSRALTGMGSYHSIAIADVMASLMGNHVLIEKETGEHDGISSLSGSAISYAIYETKDGRYVSLAALEPKFWQNFCRAVQREDWFKAHFSITNDRNPVFIEMKVLFKSRTFEEWIGFGQDVDCCLAPVLKAGELQSFPYFIEKKIVFSDGQVKLHSDMEGLSSTPPPKKGEHSETILKGLLKVSEDKVREWKEIGII